MEFTVQGAGVGVVVLLLMVLPVHLAARFVHAERATLGWSTLAVPVASFGAWLGFQLLEGLFGFLLAYFGMTLGFWLVLRTSFGNAMWVTLIAFVLQLALVQGLLRLFGN